MHRFPMISNRLRFESGVPLTVGSFGNGEALRGSGPGPVLDACDLAEVRLDLLAAEGIEPDARLWDHLKRVPLLFTARIKAEGGGMESTAAQRITWLQTALDRADAVDVEIASLSEMSDFLQELAAREIPLVASYHDFVATPSVAALEERLEIAKASGAAVFKAAARVHGPEDLTTLANFQKADHGIPKALMGMGPLGSVSRLLCSQYGSVLNYGYLGKSPTAPGQWDAARLKAAIGALVQLTT